MPQAKVNISFQVTPEWYAYIKHCAEREDRGISSYVRRVLEQHLESEARKNAVADMLSG